MLLSVSPQGLGVSIYGECLPLDSLFEDRTVPFMNITIHGQDTA